VKAGAQNDRIVIGDVALKLGKSGAELAVELDAQR
jgi:hypothetical protein